MGALVDGRVDGRPRRLRDALEGEQYRARNETLCDGTVQL